MANIVGNDIASFQGDVNYDKYKDNSNFVICKATEGTGFVDPKFKRNQTEARRVGLALGYYHFARPDIPGNTPESEAQHFLDTLGELKDGEVLVLDYEPDWNGDAVQWCIKWLQFVFSKKGCKPLIYMDQSRVKAYNWKPVVDGGYGLWLAAYSYDPNQNNYPTGAWPFMAMQQWTNKQVVPGISGKVDGDVFFGTADAFKKYGYKKPTPTPPTPPADPCAVQNKQIAELQTKVDGLNKELTLVKEQRDSAIKKVEEAKKILA